MDLTTRALIAAQKELPEFWSIKITIMKDGTEVDLLDENMEEIGYGAPPAELADAVTAAIDVARSCVEEEMAHAVENRDIVKGKYPDARILDIDDQYGLITGQRRERRIDHVADSPDEVWRLAADAIRRELIFNTVRLMSTGEDSDCA